MKLSSAHTGPEQKPNMKFHKLLALVAGTPEHKQKCNLTKHRTCSYLPTSEHDKNIINDD